MKADLVDHGQTLHGMAHVTVDSGGLRLQLFTVSLLTWLSTAAFLGTRQLMDYTQRQSSSRCGEIVITPSCVFFDWPITSRDYHVPDRQLVMTRSHWLSFTVTVDQPVSWPVCTEPASHPYQSTTRSHASTLSTYTYSRFTSTIVRYRAVWLTMKKTKTKSCQYYVVFSFSF